MGDFRRTSDQREIERLFKFIADNQIGLTCWQKVEPEFQGRQNQRIIRRTHLVDVTSTHCSLTLTEDIHGLNFSQFQKDKKVFINSQFKLLVTEAAMTEQNKQQAKIHLPHEVYLQEQRRSPRTHFQSKDKHIVEFIKDQQNYKVPILDISQSGMAFEIPSQIIPRFSFPKDLLGIIKVDVLNLSHQITGEVVYWEHRPIKDFCRVGVKFHQRLNAPFA